MKYPQTSKDIDIIVFKRVMKRLISDRVSNKDLNKYIAQAKMLFEEAVAEVRYEKFCIGSGFATTHEIPPAQESKPFFELIETKGTV